MRILLVCERLGQRDDEGIRNLARALFDTLNAHHEVLVLTQGSIGPGAESEGNPARSDEPNVIVIAMNALTRRTFLSTGVYRAARAFHPDVTLYIPWTSGTLPTFVRTQGLRWVTRRPVAIYLTQPYDNPGWQRLLIRYMLPNLVLALSDNVVRHLAQLGAEAEFVPAGVNLKRFHVPTREERAIQRERFGIKPGEKLIVHVGHLNRNRMNEGEIQMLAQTQGYRVVIVGSTSTPQDTGLIRNLTGAGCTVVSDYVPDIQQLYQAADVYLFPTRAQRSSIGVPLSVLEALACGIPVVSTRFEGLPRLFPASAHVQFFSSTAQLARAVQAAPAAPDPAARELVAELDWRHTCADIERHLVSLAPQG